MNKNKTITVSQLRSIIAKDKRFESELENVGNPDHETVRFFVYSNTGWTLWGEGCHQTYLDFEFDCESGTIGKSDETLGEIKSELDRFVETPNDTDQSKLKPEQHIFTDNDQFAL